MTSNLATLPIKRLSCAKCLRPKRACICQWITPIASGTQTVDVLILQHPLEVSNAKGSARLLHLSLPHSHMVTGELFTAQDLQAKPLKPDTEIDNVRQNILLYPHTQYTQHTPNDKAQGVPNPPSLNPSLLSDPSKLRLIVLDGTWRKSRKMLYLNPVLHTLPRISLKDMPASHYLIRKAHRADQLSTLEATCAALMQLESSVEKYQPLLTAFDSFVAQQLAYRTNH